MSIRVEHISYIYGKGSPFEKTALDDVDLTIEKGEFIGIIGHTGSGKSTLIQHLNGLIHPTCGKVTIDGVDLAEKSKAAVAKRHSVGMVFQYPEHQLFEETVAKDIAFGPMNLGCDEEETGKRVKSAMKFAGLDYDTFAGRSPFRLSGGQQRRVAIAGVIAMHPDFLILDEPINGLDPVGIKEFRQMIKRLNDELGMTILISSHILSELYLVANRFGIVDQGRLIKEISKAEFEEQGEDYIILKTSQLALASQLIQDQLHHRIKVIDKDGEIHIFGQTHDIKVIVKALVQADIDVDEIYYARQDLEKFFTDLVD